MGCSKVIKIIMDNGVVLEFDMTIDDLTEYLLNENGEIPEIILLGRYLIPISKIAYIEGDRDV